MKRLYMNYKLLLLLPIVGTFTLVGCGDNGGDSIPQKYLEIVERATQELGKPYAWGAAGPDAYDASGLVCYSLTGTHSHFATVQTFLSWKTIEDPIPGDICVNASICGIYVAPGQMIYAPTYGEVVKYGPIQNGMVYVDYFYQQ